MKESDVKIAITGKPGCGKTTLCKRITEKAGIKSRGFITEEIRKEGKRVGFQLMDLVTGETGLLSHVDKCSGPRVGKYSVCLDQLSSFVKESINRAATENNLLIIDEIGPMELKSEEFIKSVENSLETEGPRLFTVHRRSDHQLVKRVKEEFQLVKLTRNNRDKTFEKVYEKIAGEIQ